MTKQRDELPLATATKTNVVEGVLQNYLDQLLVTATQPQQVEKTIVIPEHIETSSDVSIVENDAIEVNTVENDTETIEVQAEVKEVIALEVEVEKEVEIETTVAIDSAQVELVAIDQSTAQLIDKESWSSQGVECLVFSVCGLKLAVPLLYLGGVHEVGTDDVKPLMGQPNWYLGMVHRDEQNLQVIDTASFIMAERNQSLAEQGYKYLIQLEKSPWAIACQSIDDTVRLEASEIKWRGDRGKRAWLAGTVIEKMCALIDVSGLLQRVESSSKPV